MSVDSLGLNRGYSRYILSMRLNGLAWLNNLATRLIASLSQLDFAQLWCPCGLVVFFLWACGRYWQIFRRCMWDSASFDEDDFCIIEFLVMNPTLWNDQNLCLTTLKIQVYLKNSYVF